MRKFLINVNGNSYEVEVEELTGASPAVKTPAEPAAPAPRTAATAPAAPAKAAAAVPAGGVEIKSPLPGVVLALKAAVGDKVSKGDVLLVIEAMKMENEIMAPEDGTVLSIPVSKDSSVNTGDLLLVIG
jgi:biotin carboxyl carrier protein